MEMVETARLLTGRCPCSSRSSLPPKCGKKAEWYPTEEMYSTKYTNSEWMVHGPISRYEEDDERVLMFCGCCCGAACSGGLVSLGCSCDDDVLGSAVEDVDPSLIRDSSSTSSSLGGCDDGGACDCCCGGRDDTEEEGALVCRETVSKTVEGDST